MVQLDIVHACNAEVFRSRPLVAVFAGATQGLGEATLRSVVASHGKQGKGLRVYIIGRKKERVDTLIAEYALLCPTGQFRFVHGRDLGLVKDVDKVCDEIIGLENREPSRVGPPKVDYLYMSQGDFNFEPRRDTEEGLEFRFALLYYSRIRLILNLLPLLLAAPVPAHVVSVFAAGKEGKLHLDDLDMRDPKIWGMTTNRSHVAWMTGFAFEHLATQYPGKLALVHVYPGLVMTQGFWNPGIPTWFKALFTILMPILRLLTTPLAEAGDRILFLGNPHRFPPRRSDPDSSLIESLDGLNQSIRLTVAKGLDGKLGSGAYGVNLDGETCGNEDAYTQYRAGGVGDRIWAHTTDAFAEIKAGRVWKG